MFLDFAHVFLVVTFVTVWALIGQFSLTKSTEAYPEFRPKPKPLNGVGDTH